MAGSAQTWFKSLDAIAQRGMGVRRTAGTAKLLSVTGLNVDTGLFRIKRLQTQLKSNTGGATRVLAIPHTSNTRYATFTAVGSNGYIEIYWEAEGLGGF